jgi:intracellular septation protein A
MKKQITNVIVLSIGLVLIIMGAVSVFIPIIPGILLIIFGIYLLSLKSVFVKTRLDKFIEDKPRLKSFIEKIRNKII